MKNNRLLKFASLVISSIILLNNSAFAATADEYFERTHIAHENTYTLADGVDYTENIIYDDKLGFQRTYRFDFTDTEFANLVFAQGESLYSRKTMNTLATSVEDENTVAVGAVNADFFNMSTGVPESAFIKNGILYTSDRSGYCFSRKADGKYFFGIPDVKLSMQRGNIEYHLVFLNKELANNGIYMYTDVYADTTKISVPTTEIVLYPYTEMLTPVEMAINYYGEDSLPEDLYETVEIEISPEKEVDLEPADEQVTVADDETIISEVSAITEVNQEAGNYKEDEITEENVSKIKYEYVFNEAYRLVVDMYALDNGYTNIGGNYFILGKAEPRIGMSQNAVVIETRKNVSGESLPIPEGSYVLSSDNKGYGYTLNNFSNGETVTINVSGNEEFHDVTEAIGSGCMIVKDGQIVEDNSLAHYSAANPRTAIGIKEDGSVVLFAIDGRKPGTSIGLKLSELSYEMIRAGCVEAANFDGGGSTTVKIRGLKSGELETVNSPSDSSERKVANAVVITNSAEKTGEAVHSYIKTEYAFVMPNSLFPVGEEKLYTDANHYSVDIENVDDEKFTYTAENGILSEHGYTPNGFVGIDNIISVFNEEVSNVASKVISVDKVDDIELYADKTQIYLHENLPLMTNASLYGLKVYDSISEYSWGVSEDNGYIDENGVYFPSVISDKTDLLAYFGDTKGVLTVEVMQYPFIDIEGHWSVGYCCTLYDEGVTVGEITTDGRMYFPERAYTRNEFCTMLSRIMGLTIAVDTIEEAMTPDVVSYDNLPADDMIDEKKDADTLEDNDTEITITEDAKQPEEFASITDVYTQHSEEMAVTTEATEDLQEPVSEYGKTLFEDDSSIPHWAYDSVCALYELGLLEDFAHKTATGMVFDGSFPVTRREVMSVIGRICESAPEDYELTFVDYDNESDDFQYVKNSAYAGIIEGYEDSSLRPEGNLTRAEGAAVFTRLLETGTVLN